MLYWHTTTPGYTDLLVFSNSLFHVDANGDETKNVHPHVMLPLLTTINSTSPSTLWSTKFTHNPRWALHHFFLSISLFTPRNRINKFVAMIQAKDLPRYSIDPLCLSSAAGASCRTASYCTTLSTHLSIFTSIENRIGSRPAVGK